MKNEDAATRYDDALLRILDQSNTGVDVATVQGVAHGLEREEREQHLEYAQRLRAAKVECSVAEAALARAQAALDQAQAEARTKAEALAAVKASSPLRGGK